MDERSKKEMNRHYSHLLRKYGPRKKALVYRSVDQQVKRYAILADVEPISRRSSVLDVGCGLGYFCDYLRKYGWRGRYTGIDINADMIDAARKRLPNDNFICTDILTDGFNGKYDYVFCGATIQHRPKYANDRKYLEDMVRKMFSLSKRALAFDVFSGMADYKDEDKLYVDPDRLLNFCYSLTRRMVLRNDHRPYELMVYLYKRVSSDRLNIYRDWVTPTPDIL